MKKEKDNSDFWLQRYQELREEYIDKYTDVVIERDMWKTKAKAYSFWLVIRIIWTVLWVFLYCVL